MSTALKFSWYRVLVHPGVVALRTLWLPFLILQFGGLAVLVGYYNHPPFQSFCDGLGEMKQRGGMLFAGCAQAISSGLLPEILKTLTGRRGREWLHDILFGMGVYFCAGIIVDQFYTALNALLVVDPNGGQLHFTMVLIAKVLIDQLLYTPLIAVPLIAIAFTLRRSGYDPRKTVQQLNRNWLAERVLPLLLPNWLYWFPMATVMYALPDSLTFVFDVTASAAASLIILTVAANASAKPHGV